MALLQNLCNKFEDKKTLNKYKRNVKEETKWNQIQCLIKTPRNRYYGHLRLEAARCIPFGSEYSFHDLLAAAEHGSLFSTQPNPGQTIQPSHFLQYFPNISAHLILLIH